MGDQQNNRELTTDQWESIEKREHDRIYKDSLPFDFDSYRIDPERVIWWEDYCYKPGRREDRGHRTMRVFELMGINELQGKRILDVGCGNGQYAVFFAMMGATVFAFDISPVGVSIGEKIAAANGVSERCHFSVQNASNVKYPDNFFDIVLLHEVLHHVIKYPSVKEKVLRVTKWGGLVICAESLRGNIFLRIGRHFTMKGHEAKGDVELSLRDFENFAKGFSERKIETMSLLFMVKRIFRNYLLFPPVRWFLFCIKGIDDFLLWAFSSLHRYCGEGILILRK